MEFRCLGPFEARLDGAPVELGEPQQRLVLAILLAHEGEVVSTDRLVDGIWGERSPGSARKIVQGYVSGLRRALGSKDLIESRSPGYRIAPDRFDTDMRQFADLVAEASGEVTANPTRSRSRLAEALGLWRGAPFEDLQDYDALRSEISRLDLLHSSAVEARIEADIYDGDAASVVAELADLTRREPLQERLWALRMLALYRAGRQADALRVFDEARRELIESVGLEPSTELRLVEQRILDQDPILETTRALASDGAAVERAGRNPYKGLNTLPAHRTSFVGRERELELGGTLLAESRLLTLTGPPGSGKTRLGVRLAANHLTDFPDGVFFVPLAAVTDLRLLESAVARMLGLREVPGETALEGIKAFLRDRRVLLILDNFEQILRAARQVGELIDAAPGLTIMVTSRAPLGLSGEQEFPVPPLGLPPLDELPDLEALATYDAVALFVARSRAADPNFDLTTGNAAAVAEITARLDGLPLAIELAAARVKILTPRDLLSRLEQCLAVLTGGPSDAVDRHRTLRGAIAWSYELLDPNERKLFYRLGVLRGFTLEAAASIVDLSDADVFIGVDSLLSKSLVYRTVGIGEARFAMLEMIREFALEELAAAGSERDIADRHARYFLSLAEKIEPELTQDPGGTGVQRLAPEVANIRAALRNFQDAGEPDLGLSLASSVWRFWQSSDQLIEGREWLASLLEHPKASDEARVKGLTALAGLAYWQADHDEALARYAEALELYRAMGDRFNEADTLYSMSLTANLKGDLDAGERLAEEARSIFEELGSREGTGKALLARGFSLWKQKDFAAARTLYEEGVAIARESGDPTLAVTQLIGVAALAFLLGDRNEALGIILETIEEATELHNVHIVVWALDLVAAFAAATAPEESVRLAGAVDSLRKDAGGGILPESLGVEDARAVASQMLGPESIEQAWTRGRGMSLEESIDQAYELGKLVSGP